MGKYYYCKCLDCEHTGLVVGESDSSFVCSNCKSKNIKARFWGYTNDGKGTHDNIVRSYDSCPQEDIYGDAYEKQEHKIFEEEHQLDALMMAPIGWEDDEEIQNYIGFSPEDIKEDHKQLRDEHDHLMWSNFEKNREKIKCDHPGCFHSGTYRVPKTRDLNEYWHLCKEHLIDNKLKCDHPGCNNAGMYPAPKGSNLKEHWLFCKEHAAEYNQKWNWTKKQLT